VVVGDRFGRLTVIEKSNKIDKHGCSYHFCRCDCGTIIETRSSGLSRRKRRPVQSCGCLTLERRQETHRLQKGEITLNKLERDYIKSAKRRGIEYELTREQFEGLIKLNCYWDNEPPKPKNAYFKQDGTSFRDKESRITSEWADQQWILANGIDRLDNTKGYTIDNCVPCCPDCNEAKSNMTEEAFLKHIEKIYNFQKQKGKIK
jgi:hypothetical protein